MSKEECEKKIIKIAVKFQQLIVKEALRLYSCGGVNVKEYDNAGYALPKILLSAAIENEKDSYRPLTDEFRDEVKNLMKF